MFKGFGQNILYMPVRSLNSLLGDIKNRALSLIQKNIQILGIIIG
ncbi:hypothetical protein ES703_113960 [subsurface metagenome]